MLNFLILEFVFDALYKETLQSGDGGYYHHIVD